MFTGIIEQLGEVSENHLRGHSNRLKVKAAFPQLVLGESIAVNGVCLTLTNSSSEELVFDLSPETLHLTNLGQLKKGAKVNLERALQAHGRFGGHYVTGHVDSMVEIKAINAVEEFIELSVGDFPAHASFYLLPKGSITLDGVSLTINAVTKNEIKLMLVPHTLAQTTFGELVIGQRFNVEFDYLTRIVAHQLQQTGQLKNEVDIDDKYFCNH